MSVRRRTWKKQDGSPGTAWVVAYTGKDGKRRIKTFDRKRAADLYHAKVNPRKKDVSCPLTYEDYAAIEPSAQSAQTDDPVLFSIAVSLKRLADNSDKSTEHLEQLRFGMGFINRNWGAR